MKNVVFCSFYLLYMNTLWCCQKDPQELPLVIQKTIQKKLQETSEKEIKKISGRNVMITKLLNWPYIIKSAKYPKTQQTNLVQRIQSAQLLQQIIDDYKLDLLLVPKQNLIRKKEYLDCSVPPTIRDAHYDLIADKYEKKASLSKATEEHIKQWCILVEKTKFANNSSRKVFLTKVKSLEGSKDLLKLVFAETAPDSFAKESLAALVDLHLNVSFYPDQDKIVSAYIKKFKSMQRLLT